MASRWKEQYDIEASQREELEKSIKQTRYQIQHGMAGIKEQHKTMLLRQGASSKGGGGGGSLRKGSM